MMDIKGNLLTPEDIAKASRVNDDFASLPTPLHREYYKLKARFNLMRVPIAITVFDIATAVFGFLAWVKEHDPLTLLLFVGYGVIVGIILVWVIEARRRPPK